METALTVQFADGEYRFWLPLPQVFELERVCGDVSILVIEERLRAGIGQDAQAQPHFIGGSLATTREIRETIRLGLIGGSEGIVDGKPVEVGPVRAKQLVDAYCYPSRPLSESVALAWAILSAAIYGVSLKKKADEAEPKSKSRSAKVK